MEPKLVGKRIGSVGKGCLIPGLFAAKLKCREIKRFKTNYLKPGAQQTQKKKKLCIWNALSCTLHLALSVSGAAAEYTKILISHWIWCLCRPIPPLPLQRETYSSVSLIVTTQFEKRGKKKKSNEVARLQPCKDISWLCPSAC